MSKIVVAPKSIHRLHVFLERHQQAVMVRERDALSVRKHDTRFFEHETRVGHAGRAQQVVVKEDVVDALRRRHTMRTADIQRIGGIPSRRTMRSAMMRHPGVRISVRQQLAIIIHARFRSGVEISQSDTLRRRISFQQTKHLAILVLSNLVQEPSVRTPKQTA